MSASEPLRLHIGGTEVKTGWKILNIQPGAHVDFVGTCTDLGQFTSDSAEEIYASHVLEHLGFRDELPRALKEIYRVLRPGGLCRISVPDFETLCKLFVHPETPADQKFSLMMHVFGAQEDPYDLHRVGFTADFLFSFLADAGFAKFRRVQGFDLFNDFSRAQRFGVPISLNVEAYK
ncbi:MAG: methyltransferase domain-containing protein [Alphaproteobacteria bacterium]|nr:methyltransferase domain-containing protein [Alphaproteobacteria bacterium]